METRLADAYPREFEIVDALPKTRSGKIVRRMLRAKELGLPIGDVSTLEWSDAQKRTPSCKAPRLPGKD